MGAGVGVGQLGAGAGVGQQGAVDHLAGSQ